jgi:hypothetical protein
MGYPGQWYKYGVKIKALTLDKLPKPDHHMQAEPVWIIL